MTRKHAKTRLWSILSCVQLFFALAFINYSVASDVYIHGVEEGQGISLSSGNICYIITAFHVVKLSPDITLIAPDRSMAKATLIKEFGEEIDIGVLNVSGNSSKICKGNTWPRIPDLSKIIEDSQLKGILMLREPDGSRISKIMEIDRYNDQRIYIRPISEKDAIVKGDSGGLFVVNRLPAGVLTEVDPINGEGTVIRQDFLYGFLRNMLERDRIIGEVDKLIGKSVIIKLYIRVPVGKKIYAITPDGRKIMLNVVKVHLDYASATYPMENYTPMKGDAIYEYN
jgi:hypothetical protein